MEARRNRKLALGRVATYLVGSLVFLTMAFAIFMVAYPKRIAAGTKVDGIDVSLLSQAEAEKKLELWWDSHKNKPIRLLGPSDEAGPIATTPKEIGLKIDVDASLGQLPRDDVSSWFRRNSGTKARTKEYHLVLDTTSLDTKKLDQLVAQTSPDLAPAKAFLDENGKVVLKPEVSSMKFVLSGSIDELRKALVGETPGRLAAEFAKKDVSDAELAKIKDVVSTFTTKFSAGDRSRSGNLKVAAAKIDGLVLMPGEKFSFNEFVGERSPENGFSKAGVYRQGRHEIDWGGGVCQVSTTLFNAAVLADLKIEERNNHTFLVPYVPAGRDAAVAYGTYDLVFVNTHGFPIGIDSKYEPGKLTFSILGVKDQALEVKLVPVVTESWTHEPKYVDDPNLKPGETKEIEKGGKGYRAVTTKVVLRNGVEVSRTTLCKSYYKGGPKIIARGPLPQPESPPANELPPLSIGGL